jgi:hypothetical protein
MLLAPTIVERLLANRMPGLASRAATTWSGKHYAVKKGIIHRVNQIAPLDWSRSPLLLRL